jgi:hypothetical protein
MYITEEDVPCRSPDLSDRRILLDRLIAAEPNSREELNGDSYIRIGGLEIGNIYTINKQTNYII